MNDLGITLRSFQSIPNAVTNGHSQFHRIIYNKIKYCFSDFFNSSPTYFLIKKKSFYSNAQKQFPEIHRLAQHNLSDKQSYMRYIRVFNTHVILNMNIVKHFMFNPLFQFVHINERNEKYFFLCSLNPSNNNKKRRNDFKNREREHHKPFFSTVFII